MIHTIRILAVLLILPILVRASDQKKAPDFSLTTSDGKVISMADLRGKVVIVNFWATWCGPCRKEIPDFLEVYKEYASQGLEIVGISLDRKGWKDVTPFLERNPISYPIVIGNSQEARKWGSFQYIPTTFIVDRDGNIVFKHTGLMTRTQLIDSITPLL